MVPECDSLEGNAKSSGAKINKSEKNTSILSKKKKDWEWCCTGKLKLILSTTEGILEMDFV